jgi:hypothetical protein
MFLARSPGNRNVLLDQAGQCPVHVGSQLVSATLFFIDRGIMLSKHVGELSDQALEQATIELKARSNVY